MIILIMLADILIMNLSSLPNCKLVCTTGKLVGMIGKLESTNIGQIQACLASLDQACLASLFQLDTKNVWSSLIIFQRVAACALIRKRADHEQAAGANPVFFHRCILELGLEERDYVCEYSHWTCRD